MSACYRCWTGCGFGWRVRRRAAKITASVSRRRTSYSLCRRPRFAEFSASPAVPPPSRRSAAFCPVRASRLNQSIDRSISQSIKGVPRIFHWRGKPKGKPRSLERPRRGWSGVGLFGRGHWTATPPHQLGSLEELWRSAVSSHSGVRGGAPAARRFSTIFCTQDGLSWHYNIVSYGLSCSHWGQDPLPFSLAFAPAITQSKTEGASKRSWVAPRTTVSR